MRFILRRKAYNLTKQEVEKKMQKVMPEEIRKHYIIVNNKKYPPKQILAEVLGLSRIEFTTMDASNILQRLDFKRGQL